MFIGEHRPTLRQIFEPTWQFLQFDKKDLLSIAVFTIVTGILGFAFPLSIQVLVNQLAFTGQGYPVAILASIILVIALLGTVVNLMQMFLVELIQQRIFVRVVYGAVDSLGFSGLKKEDWDRRNIASKYFDVFTFQKSILKLLTEGISIVMIATLGLIVVGVYHIFFSLLVLLIIGAVGFVMVTFFRSGLETAYEESNQKYRIADWIASIAENRSLFWQSSTHPFVLDQTDKEVSEYLHHRQQHFRIVLAQQGGLYLIQAVSSAILLGVGGLLVVIGQLNLGQLVAAETLLYAVVSGFAKFGKSLESVYDLVIASYKLQSLLGLGKFKMRKLIVDELPAEKPLHIHFLRKSDQFSGDLTAGDIICFKGGSGEGRREFLWDLVGLEVTDQWEISVQGIQRERISDWVLRDKFFFVDRPVVFDVDVRENLWLSHRSADENQRLIHGNLPLFHDDHVIVEASDQTASAWAQDPYTRLKMAITRTTFSNAPVIIIDELFAELSHNEKQSYLSHFRTHFPDKILIVNTEIDSDLKEWTKVITWI